MQKQDIVGYRTPLDAARRYKLEKVKVLKVAEDGSVAEVMLKGDAKDGSKITLKADQIDLKGKNINLTGDDVTISSTNFNVSSTGAVTASSLTLTGGSITLGSNFSVDNNGNMTCKNASFKGNITGGTIGIGSNFSVDGSGNMSCSNASVSGTINSSNGTIGGWTINSSGLTNSAVRINSDGSSTIYTVADLFVVRGYIMGYQGFSFTNNAMIKHYDFNDDGVVDARDYTILKNLIGISPD